MADRVLVIGWDNPVRGMEARAIETFNEAMGLLGRMQQDGRIEGFDVMLLSPNSDMDGLICVKGTADQIAAMRMDEEFMRNTVNATLCVENIRPIDGYTNEGVAAQMAMYQDALMMVPQRA